MFSYLVMCYGDNVLGHLGSVCLVHIVAYSEGCSWMDILKKLFSMVFVYSLFCGLKLRGT